MVDYNDQATTCVDEDNDGFSPTGEGCGEIDCDDNNAEINPGAEEICENEIDDDCDGYIDEGCEGPSITIVAHKIVCDSEEYLPNWGSVAGQPPINSTTAKTFVEANSEHCHFEQGWDFQWAFDLDNPGDNVWHASSWNTFGPTDSGGQTSTIIPNADSGIIKLREAFIPGYFPYSNDLQDNVTAEFYCDGDVFNYDNFDYIKDPIEEGETFYCVGFNAYLEDEKENEPPTCSVDYLERNGKMVELDSEINYIGEEGYFRTHGSANDSDQGFVSSSYPVSVNRTSPGSTNIWSWVIAEDVSPNPDWYNVKWYNDFPPSSGRNDYYVSGEHTICCKAVDSLGETFTGGCKDICIDTTDPLQVTGVTYSNAPTTAEEICGNEYIINYAPEFSWDAVVDDGCAPIYYELNLSFSNGTLIETYDVGRNLSFKVPEEYLISGEDYYVEVRAIDEAGNEGQWSSESEHVWYDKQDPTVEITGQPWEDAWYNDDFYVSEIDLDNLGIWKVEYKVLIPDVRTVVNWTEINENETVDVLVPEECDEEGANKCWVYKRVTDYACNDKETSRQYDIDLTAPETTKTVGDIKIKPTEGTNWFQKLINGFFVKETTGITLDCHDFGIEGDNVSGCADTYYTIDFQPFNEDGTYGAWSNVVTSEVYTGPFTLNQGDGLYNITYWSEDNAGNIETEKFEVDKVDLYAPKTSMSFISSNVIYDQLYQSKNFNFPVWMDFIKPSCTTTTIIDYSYQNTFAPSVNNEATLGTPGIEVDVITDGDWLQWTYTFAENPTFTPKMTVAINYLDGFAVTTFDGQNILDSNGDPVDKTGATWYISYDNGTILPLTGSEDWVQTSRNGNVLTVRIKKDHLGDSFSWGGYGNYNGQQVWIGQPGTPYSTVGIEATILEEAENPIINLTATDSEVGVEKIYYQILVPSDGEVTDHKEWYGTENGKWYSGDEGNLCGEENNNNCRKTYWKLSSNFSEMLNDCENGNDMPGWCEYNEEQGVVFAEECDHKICYKSVDRLGNVEEEGCTVFSIDGEGPLIYLHNPSPIFANSVETCSLNVYAESLDKKVGINETFGVEAYLMNGTEILDKASLIRNPSLDGHGSNFSGNMYTGNIDLGGIPAGDFTVKVIAEDKLGNKETIEQPVHLASGIFIDENWSPSCLIGGDGGLCELEFRACVRNSTDMDFSMSKIKPHLANVADLNATLWTEGGWGMVGQLNDTLNGYESLPDQVQFSSSSSCEEKVVNGRKTFVVSLNFTNELMETISDLQGDEINNYKFDYEVNSYLDEECLEDPEPPQQQVQAA